MDVDLEAVLEAKRAQYKSIEVHKEVELQYDLGNLLASDLNPLDTQAMKSGRDEYLKEVARDNTQLLLNKVWQLPVEKTDGMVVVELPAPTTVLPREKPIPKPKGLTTWEMFAKAKGIKKRKRSRMIFDEASQEWKPRWGYKRINDPKDKWIVEIPEKADPFEDYFEKDAEERKEKVAKNEYRRLQNIARTQKSGRLKAPLPPPMTKDMSKHQLTHALGKAKVATASVGKFTKSLPDEPTLKKVKKTRVGPVAGDLDAERKRNLEIISSLAKKQAVLDTEKAANRQMAQEQRSKREGREGQGRPLKRRTNPKKSLPKKSQPRKRGKGKYTKKT